MFNKTSFPHVLLSCIGLCFLTTGFSFDQPLRVHPENVRANTPFLIEVSGSWSDGCGGEILTTVTPSEINITAEPIGRVSGAVCPAVILPYKQLINPYDELISIPANSNESFEFDQTVTINYYVTTSGADTSLIESRSVTFSNAGNPITRAENGLWVSDKLQSSALSIDQQDEVMSLTFTDYLPDGQPVWYFSVGKMNGNTFVGKLKRYNSNIECVRNPCPRAVSDQESSIYILINQWNAMTVQYSGVIDNPLFDIPFIAEYKRLSLSRNSQIPKADVEIPDLTGNWVLGYSVKNDASEFNEYIIEYGGTVRNASGLDSHKFDARLYDTVFQSDENTQINFYCTDETPLDGEPNCRLDNLSYQGSACSVYFPFSAVGNERLKGTADCFNAQNAPASDIEFYMLKLD